MSEHKKQTLKEHRVEQRYTMQQVSDGSGVPFGTYVGYDCRTRKMSLENAKKIANFLGIAVEDIEE